MYQAMAKRKHTYLHKVLPTVESGKINRSVQRAMDAPIIDIRDLQPPAHPPASLQPASYAPKIDATKAELAFGLWGIPQLIRQLHDHDEITRYRALGTLNDELRNPEKFCQALHNGHIVKRLADIINEQSSTVPLSDFVVERTALNLAICATYLDGAAKIAIEQKMLDQLYDFIQSENDVAFKIAEALSILSNHLTVAESLVENGHLDKVMIVLRRIDSIYDVFVELSHLIERCPDRALESGFFEFLFPLIEQKGRCQPIILKCFACLIQCDAGHRKCDEADAIQSLYNILMDEGDEDTMIFEFAAMALHNCLLNTRSRWRAREFWNLPLALVRHAHCKTNERLQIHSLQVIRQLTEMPSIKDFVRKVCKRNIKSICCNSSEQVRTHKFALLHWLRYRNYRHPRQSPDNDAESVHDSDNEGQPQVKADLAYRIKAKPFSLRNDSDDSDHSTDADTDSSYKLE